MAISPDGKKAVTLHNGVFTVIDLNSLKAQRIPDYEGKIVSPLSKGLIPSGWGPTRVELSNDEKFIFIITCRGWGAGPNGGAGFVIPVQGNSVSQIQLGSFQKVSMPADEELAIYTKQAVDNTFTETEIADDGKNPLPPLPKIRKSPIKHIVYITKENRTYDEVFGQLKGGAGDSTLARYGINNT